MAICCTYKLLCNDSSILIYLYIFYYTIQPISKQQNCLMDNTTIDENNLLIWENPLECVLCHTVSENYLHSSNDFLILRK